MNCRNHHSALVLVHLLPKYQEFSEIDGTILALWKLMKYSSVKAAIFQEVQQANGKKVQKLLKAATTQWLSHNEASIHLVSYFQAVLDALDAMIAQTNEPEIDGIRQQFVKPDYFLFLLLLADVFSPLNRLSRFLQTKNLIHGGINRKVQQFQNSLQAVQESNVHLFKENVFSFLEIIEEQIVLGRRLRSMILLSEGGSIEDQIRKFRQEIKTPFLQDLMQEIDLALNINHEVLLAFDMFNTKGKVSEEETLP